jgi:glutaconate CoA-transferase subunit A
MNSPYHPEESVITVPALQPDVLLLHAHAADTRGNVVLNEPWTNFTLTTAQACQRVLVTVEEIVPFGSLKASDITIPHFLVDAIAQVSYGAAPTALNRCYEVDFTHIAEYQKAAQTPDDFHQYLRQYILGCDSHGAFLKKTGFPPPWITRTQVNANLEENLL